MWRGGWDIHTLGLKQTQKQTMEKRGGIILCAHTRVSRGESPARPAESLVALILPWQVCSRPPPSWRHPSIHLHVSSVSSDGGQLSHSGHALSQLEEGQRPLQVQVFLDLLVL